MTEYDYGSLMHYESSAFTRNGLRTIIPIKNSSAVIGQRIDMSKTDILEVQRYYQCVPYDTAIATSNTIILLIISLSFDFFF